MSGEDNIGWAAAIEASKVVEEAKPEPLRLPVKGEWVSHAKFGLCRIDLIRGDIMTIKLPNARRTKLRLDYVEFGPSRRDGEKVIYTVKAKKRS